MTTRTTIPARSGMAVTLQPNQVLQVINTYGTQVVDTWAFMCDGGSAASQINLNHHMSQSHTRATLCRAWPTTGDVLYSNRRQGMLQLIQDTSAGRHDTLIAACDIWRYRELTGRLDRNGRCKDNDDGYYHESCAENLALALKKGAGVDVSKMAGWGNGPDPLNLWMNIPIHSSPQSDRRDEAPGLSFQEPVSEAGDYVRLKNVSGQQVVVVMSACPQDLLDINCRDPKSVEFVVEEE
ncbi:hypothetical protein DV735_g1344, partial [Chaetothyriales sp. CBS 134920]